MEIEKHLPFECCETCPEFIMKVQQRTLFYGDDGSHIGLTVSCKNESKCVHLKKSLMKMNELK